MSVNNIMLFDIIMLFNIIMLFTYFLFACEGRVSQKKKTENRV